MLNGRPTPSENVNIQTLFDAVKSGDINNVTLLLTRPDIVKNIAENDNVALCLAVKKGHIDIVKLLLTYPDVVNHIAAQENEVLCLAAQKGHIDIVKLLLTYPDVVNHITAKENCALWIAAQEGYIDIIKLLLTYPDVVKNIAVDNNYALRAAADEGHIDIVKLLLTYPDVVKNDSNNRVLAIASKNGHIELVKILLTYPDVVNHITDQNNLAFKIAVQNGHIDVVKTLLNYPDVVKHIAENKNEALFLAVRNGHLDVVKTLLNYPDVANHIPDDILGHSANEGHIDIFNLLLTYPQVVNNITAGINFALRLAAANGHYGIMNRLLAYPTVRAELFLFDTKHAETNNLVTKIVDNAHPDLKNILLIERAAFEGKLDQLNILLENPTVLAKIADDNNHVLNLAIGKGHVEVVRKLLSIESVTEHVIADNFNPMRLAQSKHRLTVVKLFRDIPGAQQIIDSLAFMALDPESSMGNSAAGQSQALTAIKKDRYGDVLRVEGQEEAVLAQMKAYLLDQYQKYPAMNGMEALPLAYDPTISPQVQAQYLTHLSHTVCRYLFPQVIHPQGYNPWLGSTVLFVNRSENGHGTARIDAQERTTIAALWLFINDETLPLPSHLGREALKALLVKSLYEIARGHNFEKPDGSPGSDNGQADNPSCAMGVRERLSQFVDILVADINLPELRDLTPAMLRQCFYDWMINLADGDENRLFTRIDRLTHFQLKQLALANKNFALVGDYAAIDQLEALDQEALRKALPLLAFPKEALENFITFCHAFYGKTRITRETENQSFQSKPFTSFEALIRKMAEELLFYFGAEIDQKIQSAQSAIKKTQLQRPPLLFRPMADVGYQAALRSRSHIGSGSYLNNKGDRRSHRLTKMG